MDLNSLNLEGLGDIMSSLSEEDISKLSNLADELFRTEEEKSPPSKEKAEGKTDFFSGIDPSVMGKIAAVMGKLNSHTSDPRCDLIASLKPLLSKDKQQKADEAIKVLQLLSVIPILGDTL